MQNKIRVNALCIILNNKRILALKGLDKTKGEEFLRLLGGGVDFGETSLIALKREFKEELGATIKDEKLLEVIENIFEYNGETMHEITFLYSAEIIENEYFESPKFKILDSEKEKYAEWVELDEVKEKGFKIYPTEAAKYI